MRRRLARIGATLSPASARIRLVKELPPDRIEFETL